MLVIPTQELCFLYLAIHSTPSRTSSLERRESTSKELQSDGVILSKKLIDKNKRLADGYVNDLSFISQQNNTQV